MTDCEVKMPRFRRPGQAAPEPALSAPLLRAGGGDDQGRKGSKGGMPGQPNRICTDTSCSPDMIMSQ
jgi:hypothetical protein